MGLIGLGPQTCGADAASEQIERARVLRELAESSPPLRGDGRRVPQPERPEAGQLDAAQEQAVIIDSDLRWRNLLADQARERNAPEAHQGAARIRPLLDRRGQDARDLHQRIQRQDLESRLQRVR